MWKRPDVTRAPARHNLRLIQDVIRRHSRRCPARETSVRSDPLRFEIGAHALWATAATDALDHQADIAKVQEWLGHANIGIIRIYDRRKTQPEDSPTFKVN
jgi:site-specific recombinase XerD